MCRGAGGLRGANFECVGLSEGCKASRRRKIWDLISGELWVIFPHWFPVTVGWPQIKLVHRRANQHIGSSMQTHRHKHIQRISAVQTENCAHTSERLRE